jgi:hypothetical protein
MVRFTYLPLYAHGMNRCFSLNRKLSAAEDLVSGENESAISVGCYTDHAIPGPCGNLKILKHKEVIIVPLKGWENSKMWERC